MKPTKPTNTNRIPRVNSLIQQKLGEVLREYLDGEKGLTTISKVETTRDLKHAKVWLSIIPTGNLNNQISSPQAERPMNRHTTGGKIKPPLSLDDRILKIINDNIYDIQGALNSAMNTKIFPRLSFHLDTSPRYVQHIDELIRKAHNENEQK